MMCSSSEFKYKNKEYDFHIDYHSSDLTIDGITIYETKSPNKSIKITLDEFVNRVDFLSKEDLLHILYKIIKYGKEELKH